MTIEVVCASRVGGGGRPPAPVRLAVWQGIYPDSFASADDAAANCPYVVRLSGEFNRGANQVFSMSISDALVVSGAIGGVLVVAWIFRTLRRIF